MNRFAFIGIVVVAALIVIVGSWYVQRNPGSGTAATSTATSTGNGAATSTPPSISSVRLALLDTEGTTGGAQRGCDRVVLVPFTVATTTAPLASAMQRLFALSTTSVDGLFNFIDRTNETLSFERATIVSGTANIYLTGSLSGLAGVCDDPRAQIQIEETALQFDSVQRVQIYLDGIATNLTPSQQ